jgi:hypothetical protein
MFLHPDGGKRRSIAPPVVIGMFLHPDGGKRRFFTSLVIFVASPLILV